MKTNILRQHFEKIQENITWGHFANLLDLLFFSPKKNISICFFPIAKFFTSHRKVRGAKTIENNYFEKIQKTLHGDILLIY